MLTAECNVSDNQSIRRRKEGFTQKPIYTAAPLILPDISSVPISVWPEVSLLENPSCLEAWGKFILEMIPDCQTSWKKGIAEAEVLNDILSLLGDAVRWYGWYSCGLPLGERAVSVEFDDKKLTLSVSPLENIYLLCCKDAMERATKECPRVFPLVKKAFNLLYFQTLNWEELRSEAFDYHSDVILDLEGSMGGDEGMEPDMQANREEIENHRGDIKELERFAAMTKKHVGPRKISGRFIKGYEKELKSFRAVSDAEKEVFRWCCNVAALWKRSHLQTLSDNDDDMTLNLGEMFPLLWSRGDIITEWFDMKMDDYFNSGYTLEPLLKIALGKGAEEDRENLGLLKKDIEHLGLLRTVFNFW